MDNSTYSSRDWGVPRGPTFSSYNIVINTLVDTLATRVDLGYTLHKSCHSVNTLQYADDTCLLANCPAACQELLNTVYLEISVVKIFLWFGYATKIMNTK